MTRSLPTPRTVLGRRQDGRPIYPVLGASSDDPSNDEVTVNISQKQLNTLMAREKDQGGRAAIRTLVEKLGFANAGALEEHLVGVRQAEQEQLSEAERREQALAEREKAAAAREAAALARERDAARRAVLSDVGATGHDLDDAVALLHAPDDAEGEALANAVQELKARRPELFGTVPVDIQQFPAAPGGAPASVPPSRPGGVDSKPGSAGLEMARRRGILPAPE